MFSERYYTTTQIAQDFRMPVGLFYKKLTFLGIVKKVNGQWQLCDEYKNKGYTAAPRYYKYYNASGQKKTSTIIVWTEIGRQSLHQLVMKSFIK